ncbi:MAG: response regulator [Chloroflexota bacterium]
MSQTKAYRRILIAEDDEDDRLLLSQAFKEINFTRPIETVNNGEELLAVLRSGAPLPALILLDLNMPVKNGREALLEIRADAHLRHLPVVVMSTSSAPSEIAAIYRSGANSCITKPNSFKDLVNILQTTTTYWLDVVQLPGQF